MYNSVKNKLLRIVLMTILSAFASMSLFAQDNVRVQFRDASNAPRFLNVCGDAQTVIVTVNSAGSSGSVRSNLTARLALFQGVQFVGLDAAQSSAGVNLLSNTGGGGTFRLPDLSAGGTFQIAYQIRANCGYTDTLMRNDRLTVQDSWTFNYNLGAQTGLSEIDLSAEYRDAIKVPFFTMSLVNSLGTGGASVGQCVTRTMTLNNSGLEGFVKEFVYTNTQAPGVSVTALTVNGQTIPITKTPMFNASGDTLITAIVTGGYFRLNTMGAGGLADADTLFEANETVRIVETACVVNCTQQRTSTHAMNWGCDSRYCQVISRQDLIRLAEGSVNVSFASTGSVARVNAGYCQTGRHSVRFINNGIEVDPGTANMMSIGTGAGLGNALSVTAPGYRITRLTIAGVVINNPAGSIARLDSTAGFTTDPDGVGVGLADLDGDGKFDDLPRGQSVEIAVEYETDCSLLQSLAENGTNDIEAGFSARMEYTNFCNDRIVSTQPNYFSPLNANDLIDNCADPDAQTDGRPFKIEHLERRNVFNFGKSCGGQEQFIVKIKLPTGVTPIMDSMRLSRFTDNLPRLSHRISNDTLYMYFNAATQTNLNGDYKLNMDFAAGCTAQPGLSQFPIALSFLCPTCGCEHIWYNDTITGARIHYAQPPCPANPAYICTKGLQTTSFTALRTTLGYTDQTYATRIAPENANRKVAIQCDSIEMCIKNIVGATPISDSIGMVISHVSIDRSATADQTQSTFLFGRGVLRLVTGGGTFECPVDASHFTTTFVDSVRYYRFNLNSCLTGLGITLQPGDSVNFCGYFAVNANGPFLNAFKKIPDFRAYGYYKDNGVFNACDDYGDVFRLGKNQVLFAYPNSSNMPKGCDEASLNYQILVQNNGFRDYFGEEYRAAVMVDSIVFVYDTAFLSAFTHQVEVSIPDHPLFGNMFFPIGNFDASGRYAARFDTLRIVPSYNRISSYAFNFRVRLIPNCRSLTGSSRATNRFNFDPKIFYKDRYYALEIGNGSCVNRKTDQTDGDITYTDPPSLSFVPATTPSVTTADSTAEWTVKVCNTSARGNAGSTWFAVEFPAGMDSSRLDVLSMTDVTTPTNPIALTVRRYGTNNYVAFGNPLTIANASSTIDDVCNSIKIKVRVRNCGSVNFNATSGWNCRRPSDSITWNPTRYAPCTNLQIPLELHTEAPNLDGQFIGASLRPLPGICDTTVMEILLRNTDIGKVYDVRTRVTIPLEGATLLPNSFEVAYPSSAAYAPALGAPVSAGSDFRGRHYDFSSFGSLNSTLNVNGLNGFNALTPNDSNEFKIRFKFLNDCAFKVGAQSYFAFVGRSACGTPSNNESGDQIMEIQGATLSQPKSYSVNLDTTASRFVPGGTANVFVSIKNLTDTPSDSSENIVVRLPIGVTYQRNSSVGIAPTGWIPDEPSIRTVAGLQILSWTPPPSMRRGDSANLRFRVQTSEALPCDNSRRDISLFTTAEKTLVCSTSGTPCTVEIITTSGGEHYYTLPLMAQNLDISANVAINSGQITTVSAGTPIRISATGGINYLWINTATNDTLGRDSVLNYTPTTTRITIRVQAASGSSCIGSASLIIIPRSSNAPPTITIGDTTIRCTDSIPTNRPVVTDDTDLNPTVTFRDSTQTLPCGIRILRTWTATDRDGNSATAVQTITRTDNQAPRITTVNPLLNGFRNGDTLTFECDRTPVFAASDVRATDDCSTPTVSFVDLAQRFGICAIDNYYILMSCVWVATDACGNRDSLKIFIKMTDNNPPVFGPNLPRDTVVVSNAAVPVAVAPTATDACSTPRITLTESRLDSVITRTWTATDQCGNTSVHTYRITVSPNGGGSGGGSTIRPDAVNDFATVGRNGSITLNVLLNDVTNGTLTVLPTVVSTPRRGTATLSGNNIIYTPNANICGVMDTFTYRICNSIGCDTAQVFLWISCDTTGGGGGNGGGGLSTLRPDAHDDVATVGRNGSVTMNLLLNDITNGVLISPPSIVSNPRRGTAVWNGVMMVYRPNAGICGVMDTFTYQICNANGCDTANAVIAILCDTTALRPDARDDAASTRTNTTVSIAILLNDITNGTLIAAPSILRNPGLGRAIIRNDSVIYTPNLGICGATDTLTYRICNSNGCDTATVIITITCDTTGGGGGTLLRPDARDDAASTVLNTPVSIPVLSNDVTNGTLTVPPSIVSNPRRGTAVLNGNNIVYTPNNGICGTNDTLTYRICNSNGCDTANVVITISCDTGVVGVPRCISDTTAPVIFAVNAALIGRVSGDTITRSCGDELFFQLADVRVTDNCDTLPRLGLDSVITNGTCRIDGYIKLKRYTWTATDTRNNVTTLTIIVKIADTEAPVIVNVPNDVVLNRRDPIPATPTNVVATDNCDPNPVLTFRQTIDTVGTDTIYNRIWTATDACGNTTTRKWVITKRGRSVCGGTVNRLPITLAQSDCSVAASYCMPLPPATLQNDYEIRVDGQRYLGALTACDSTNSSTRLMFVTGRHIVEFYNIADDCRDTVRINVICNGSVPIETIYNDICIGQRLPGCLSTLVRFRNQRVVYANNICAAAGGTVTSYEIDSNYCFNFRGLTRGRDTACFVICTDSGRCLQLQFVTTVTGVCSGIDTIRIALPVGRTDTVCVSRIPLGYSPTRPPVNYCQDTTSTRLVIDPIRNCIAITGTRPGTSQACIRVCDSTGTRCDTTIIIISVNPARGITPPIAMDDSGRTRKNIPIQLDLMANDSLGTLQAITLVSEPRNGIATLGNDPKRTLTYVPNRDFCGSLRPEIFSYRICDQGGCATANIKIIVMCDTLRIYNGFSPNNDGKNDIFVVDGIEDYPNTLVQVYNRWGNQVYNNPDYHNDWDGTFFGQPLPDGTYFYVVLLATGERFVGYLQIHR